MARINLANIGIRLATAVRGEARKWRNVIGWTLFLAVGVWG